MSAERAGVFDDADLGDFKPRPKPAAVRAVAEQAGFPSRAPVRQADPAPQSQPQVEDGEFRRVYRTGRDKQLNLKVRPADAKEFYALADREGIVLGELFARMIQAYKRELSGG